MFVELLQIFLIVWPIQVLEIEFIVPTAIKEQRIMDPPQVL
jgi:hypothetical protein